MLIRMTVKYMFWYEGIYGIYGMYLFYFIGAGVDEAGNLLDDGNKEESLYIGEYVHHIHNTTDITYHM